MDIVREAIRNKLNDTMHEVYQEHPELRKKDVLNKIATGVAVAGSTAAVTAVTMATGLLIPPLTMIPVLAGVATRSAFTDKKEKLMLDKMEKSEDPLKRGIAAMRKDYQDKQAYARARGMTYIGPDPLLGVSVTGGRKLKLKKNG